MKTYKSFPILFSLLNLYLALSYLKRYNKFKLPVLDPIIYDNVWFLLTPILFLFTILLIFIYIFKHKGSFFSGISKFNIFLFIINIIAILLLTYFSIIFWDSATDGGLF